jgi:hypothetical protein
MKKRDNFNLGAKQMAYLIYNMSLQDVYDPDLYLKMERYYKMGE